MSIVSSEVGPRRLRRPGRTGRVVLAVALVVAVALAGAGTYAYVLETFGGTTLVIYTYPSLLGGANCNGAGGTFAAVFGAFASAHHVRIDVQCPAGTLYNTLLAQRGAPTADLVIGLDEITAPEAEAAHLLVPYASRALGDVPSDLVAQLSPAHGVTPYEYGYLGVDYNLSFAAATAGAVASWSFPATVANATWAKNLLVEDPTLDITGQEFLVWQIEFYEHVLHQDWTSFWTDLPAGAPPLSDSWGDAYSAFLAGTYPMVVSYTTDSAYAAYYHGNQSGPFNSTVSWWNGTAYGWRTVYGIGIVNGSRHLALDQEFVDWFLTGAVQNLIPTNEWEYPANLTVPLPPAFAFAMPPASIVALNNDTTPAEVGASVQGWVDTWNSLTLGHG